MVDSKENYKFGLRVKGSTLDILTSVGIFSILLSLYFLRC